MTWHMLTCSSARHNRARTVRHNVVVQAIADLWKKGNSGGRIGRVTAHLERFLSRGDPMRRGKADVTIETATDRPLHVDVGVELCSAVMPEKWKQEEFEEAYDAYRRLSVLLRLAENKMVNRDPQAASIEFPLTQDQDGRGDGSRLDRAQRSRGGAARDASGDESGDGRGTGGRRGSAERANGEDGERPEEAKGGIDEVVKRIIKFKTTTLRTLNGRLSRLYNSKRRKFDAHGIDEAHGVPLIFSAFGFARTGGQRAWPMATASSGLRSEDVSFCRRKISMAIHRYITALCLAGVDQSSAWGGS